MTTQDPNASVAAHEALQRQWKDLFGKISLPDISHTVTDTSDKLQKLPEQIVRIRQRGYVFASYLEQKRDVLVKRWDDIKRNILSSILSESGTFRTEYNRIDSLMTDLGRLISNPATLDSSMGPVKQRITDLENRIEATEKKLKTDLGSLPADVDQTLKQLTDITWYLDQKDEASFKFLAGESLFLAAKAEWVETGKGKTDPDGILYLSDQRLVFEQKETTGKTLGLFGGKKTQELKWEVPLNLIAEVKAENKGLFGGKDMLYFTLKSGAPFSQITVEVKGGVACKFWAAQIQRMISGNTKDERAIQPDAEELKAIKQAPTACPSCGGTLPMLVAGQNQIDCGYCGTVIRV
ncbi:MAG: hypothetical protein H0X30_20790 [Anaerolineae bacterium]|nr:hypothetical protein [Anaerolineae bacterium]